MIDIFQPLIYEIVQPISEEISSIRNSSIEKYEINRMPCSQYIRAAEGFFRLRRGGSSTEHTEYVSRKTSEIYEVVKTLSPDSTIIRIDYFLNSGLMIGVYVREDLAQMIGAIRGYRADKMTEAEFQKLWYGSSPKPFP
jgi:hypothetical protein